jgi:hypothetical protein
MRKRTSTPSSSNPAIPANPETETNLSQANTLRYHLQNRLAIAHVRLLLAEWHLFWHRESGFTRQAQKKSIKQVESFVVDRCPWLSEAIKLQQRCRNSITAGNRKLAVLHIDSILAACNECEASLKPEPRAKR